MESIPQYEDREIAPDEVIQPGASWTAAEYHHRPKSKDWYWALGMVTLTIAIISFVLGDALFGIFIIIAAFSLAMFSHREPSMVTIEMGTRGILVNNTLYLYKDMESFWVDMEENPNHPKIIFKSKHFFMPYITIPMGDMHPDDVAEFLLHFLPEVEHKESILIRLFEDFGF